MNRIGEKKLNNWKETLAKSGLVLKTDDEYLEAFHNLVGYFDVLIQMDYQQQIKKRAASDSN
ncbi:MAG: hypothetical protein U0516_02505 [Candidatus Saccharibacteria bacterium]